ncbi:MAG: 3-(cis-5,6-dihydroxycyclohexa-1,3-dien-1-yl)propanoate dehydrogenase [Candidatus Binataceae bacterium]
MGELEGQVALVTGGASGLGKAIVERFLQEGASVGILDRAKERTEALRNELGDRVSATVGDVTLLADNRRAVADTVAKFGRLDCFIGNAGVWDFNLSLALLPDDRIEKAFDELFGINVKGCMLGAKAAMTELAKTQGNIIYTVSFAGFHPSGGGPLYTSSKHALVGLVRELAFELAPKIRVNGVAPGPMPTDLRGLKTLEMENRTISEVVNPEQSTRGLPLARFPDLEDYTGAYLMLASRKSGSLTTGHVINCDSGLEIRGIMRPAGGDDL